MIKRLVALLLVTMPALAQPGPAAVFFAFDGPGANRRLVDNAMHAALERPEAEPRRERFDLRSLLEEHVGAERPRAARAGERSPPAELAEDVQSHLIHPR